jgi:hypothetical protein
MASGGFHENAKCRSAAYRGFVSLAIPGVVNCANAQVSAQVIGEAARPNDNGRVLVASNVLKLASPGEVSGTGFFGGTAKRFLVPFNGVVRVKWKIKTDASGQPASIGVTSAVETCIAGTNLSTTSQTYVEGSCDLRVVAGDIVYVTVKGSQPFPANPLDPPLPPTTGFMQDVRLFYDVKNGNGLGKVLP